MSHGNRGREDEDKDDLQQIFKDLYKGSIMLTKKNKKLKEVKETMTNENKELRDKVASIEKEL